MQISQNIGFLTSFNHSKSEGGFHTRVTLNRMARWLRSSENIISLVRVLRVALLVSGSKFLITITLGRGGGTKKPRNYVGTAAELQTRRSIDKVDSFVVL